VRLATLFRKVVFAELSSRCLIVTLGKQVKKIYKYDKLYYGVWNVHRLVTTGALAHVENDL
jgi:CRISPR/Cas system-associated protein Csm6